MRKITSLSMVLGMVLCAPLLGAQAGSPNTTPGTVSRVTLLRINPGHGDMFWQDVRQHALPIWEEQKRFNPGFAEYEEKTARQIPVIVLEPETSR